MSDKILRRTEVEAITGLKRSTLYAAIKNGEFPSPLKLTTRSVGWLESTISEWIDSRPNSKKAND